MRERLSRANALRVSLGGLSWRVIDGCERRDGGKVEGIPWDTTLCKEGVRPYDCRESIFALTKKKADPSLSALVDRWVSTAGQEVVQPSAWYKNVSPSRTAEPSSGFYQVLPPSCQRYSHSFNASPYLAPTRRTFVVKVHSDCDR